MSNWPDTLRIGPYAYRLNMAGDATLMDMADANGAVDYDDLRITLRPNMPPSRLRVVVMHEVVHAILNSAVGSHLDLTNEQRTEILSAGLVLFAADNPEAWGLMGEDQNDRR